MPTIYVLSKNKKKITFFHVKIVNFYSLKNCSILNSSALTQGDNGVTV